MFTSSPRFVHIQTNRFAPRGAVSWLWLVPGVTLILLALAIVLWPELLAYLVAGAIMAAGVGLTAWGWAMRRATRQVARANVHPNEVNLYRTDVF